MSQHVGVIAALGLDAYALADRFPTVPEDRFASSGAWVWRRFDPEESIAGTLGAEEVAKQFAKPKGLALDIRTLAHAYWSLSVYPPKGAPRHVAFHHALCRLSTGPKAQGTNLPAGERVTRLDASLPEAFRTPEDVLAKAQGKPVAKGLAALKKTQAARVATLVNAFECPGDEVRAALTGAGCSAAELSGPFGMLPKFLDAMRVRASAGRLMSTSRESCDPPLDTVVTRKTSV